MVKCIIVNWGYNLPVLPKYENTSNNYWLSFSKTGIRNSQFFDEPQLRTKDYKWKDIWNLHEICSTNYVQSIDKQNDGYQCSMQIGSQDAQILCRRSSSEVAVGAEKFAIIVNDDNQVMLLQFQCQSYTLKIREKCEI